MDIYGVLLHLVILVKSSYGVSLLQFNRMSLLPDNLTSLLDDSPHTCAQFNISLSESPVPKFTIFRFELPEYRMDYVNVTLIGNYLGCGYNLYISPLAGIETEKWTGRWKSCHLEETSIDNGKLSCTYHCKCPNDCEQIQVLKRSTEFKDGSWILCDIEVDLGEVGCSEVRNTSSGVYPIKLLQVDYFIDAYCDMETDDGGWTVLMRRKDGSENFNREWTEYKEGFGSPDNEFWAGNEFIHNLTSDGRTYTLRVDLTSYSDESIFALYDHFSVGPEQDNYRLHVSGFSSESTAGDSLSEHDGAMFSTPSRDNDYDSVNCASKYSTGWWFTNCFSVHLNGYFGKYPNVSAYYGIIWKSNWGGAKFAKFVTMMVRPNM